MNNKNIVMDKKITNLEYCLMNYQCKCLSFNNSNDNLMDYSFNFFLENYNEYISRKNKPNTYIDIKINNKIIGKIYLITIKPGNLKRTSQQGTVEVNLYIYQFLWNDSDE